MYIAYLRGYEGKSKPKYIKGSLIEKKYIEGKTFIKTNQINRYL
jgi:hypothetical protein